MAFEFGEGHFATEIKGDSKAEKLEGVEGASAACAWAELHMKDGGGGFFQPCACGDFGGGVEQAGAELGAIDNAADEQLAFGDGCASFH